MPYFVPGKYGRRGYASGSDPDLIDVTITAGVNDRIPFTEAVSGAAVATLTAGTYTSGAALAAEVQARMRDAQSDVRVFNCSFAARKLTISRAILTFSLDWATTPTNSAGVTLGWNAADVPATLSTTADNAL